MDIRYITPLPTRGSQPRTVACVELSVATDLAGRQCKPSEVDPDALFLFDHGMAFHPDKSGDYNTSFPTLGVDFAKPDSSL